MFGRFSAILYTAFLSFSVSNASAVELPYTPPAQLAAPADWFVQACHQQRNTLAGAYLMALGTEPTRACLATWKPAMETHTYQDKQYGLVWLSVDQGGTATMAARFSNGEKWNGEAGMSVVLRFADGDGNIVRDEGLWAVVRGAEFHDGSREENRLATFRLAPEEWAKIATVTPTWHRFTSPEQWRQVFDRDFAPKLPDHPTFLGE